ncbi:CidA/LrgA family protein [Motiliproteus sp. SC1-56]|uniref:CidA/LrgA family protein n=1 Tax=Motiliproteus sp. SC1-56 TaxID=2799565 RepID=UPI001A8EE0EB|nr:CidA/LrgA family protein [Motiliproteus sp. SC1-56]
MIRGLTTIMLFWVLGESLHFLTGLAVSGNVLGMLLLFAWLLFRQRIDLELEQASSALIAQLSLLLLPGGVGLFFLGERMSGQWLPLLTAVIVGSLLSTFICLVLMKALVARKESR